MRTATLFLLAVFVSNLGAQVVWKRSDALGNDLGPAPQAKAGPGWILRVEARENGEERTLFKDGVEESMRVLDLDLAGRVVRSRDIRSGVSIWEVTYDPATGLPVTETVFEDDQPAQISTLEFSAGVLVHRTVRNASQKLVYEDWLRHWPDGTLRRLERNSPSGPLGEAAWSYGAGGKLVGAWSSDEDLQQRGEHQQWTYGPGKTEETLATDAAVLVSRVTEWLETGQTRETKTDLVSTRQEVRSSDAQGRTTEEIVSIKGTVVQTRRWTYDQDGRVVTTSVESAGPTEVWTYRYDEDTSFGALTRDGVLVREELVRDGEKQTVNLYDRGELFLVETWDSGKPVKETYYRKGVIVRERTP